MESAKNTTSLQITGMTCSACASRIKKGLGRLEGVQEANVNFALERATVTYEPQNDEQYSLKFILGTRLQFIRHSDSCTWAISPMDCRSSHGSELRFCRIECSETAADEDITAKFIKIATLIRKIAGFFRCLPI